MTKRSHFIVAGCILIMGCERMSSGEKVSQVPHQRTETVVSGVAASLHPTPIVIGKGRVGQLYRGELRVWKIGNWKAPELELGTGLRGVTALSDGSLAVVGDDAACVLRPGAHSFVCDKFFGILPREGLAAIFGASDGALVLHEGSLVTRFRLTGKEAARDGSIILQKPVEHAAPIGSSTIVWLDNPSVKTLSSTGERTEWQPPPLATPLHLAPVRDGVWVSLTDKHIVLLQNSKVVRTVSVEHRVISIAADDKSLSVLTADDAQRRLHVSLFDASGTKAWNAELPFPTPPLFEKEPYVALSPFEPIVVVGSAATLQVLERASGKQLGEAG
jgi:hypothetical protein